MDGDVQFETWKEGDERHEWIVWTEIDHGQYEATYSFEDEGDYHIAVYLADEEIHDHVQY